MLRFLAVIFLSTFILGGCAHPKLVDEIKLISFESVVGKGKSLAEVEGKSCKYHVFGIWIGGPATFGDAISEARNAFVRVQNVEQREPIKVRYLNNITMEMDSLNFGFFGKRCIIARGLGFE